MENAKNHPFNIAPHKTLLQLSLPVLLSLIAEPITGLVDTGFIARLGAAPLAALGVGTTSLSAIFWAFNFLGIGTQTEVARDMGRGDDARVARIAVLAVSMGLLFGILLIGIVQPLTSALATLMGASGEVHTLAMAYIRVRLFGAPAVLITIASFGVFRGRQNMRTPLLITTAVNLLNIVLDPLLIFGAGQLPGLGVYGAALASVISQWIGALTLILLIHHSIGVVPVIRFADTVRLLRIGKDLFIRTGMITLFILLATRAATQLGAPEGAAHQAIRQIWILTALFLDAYAVAGQSLVAWFAGARQTDHARRVSRIVCTWSLFTGLALSLIMWIGQYVIITLFVPAEALSHFQSAWPIALLVLPVNALAFATDGIHWGTGDFRYLRNAALTATVTCAAFLFLLRDHDNFSLGWIWTIMAFWTLIRAAAGILRIWPGIGRAPLRVKALE